MGYIIMTVVTFIYAVAGFFAGSLIAFALSIFSKDKCAVFSSVSRVWARSLLFVSGISLEIEGVENLDVEGPKVIISNHQGNFDIPILIAAMPLHFRFLVKKELVRVPFFGWYLRNRGDIAIDRHAWRSASSTLQEVTDMMKDGETFLIFPEGTRSRDGNVGEFKRGSLIAAQDSGAKIIPVSISGSINIQKRGSFLIKPAKVRVNIGKAMDAQGLSAAELRDKVISLMSD